MQMIFHGPAREAKLIEEKTGTPTVAATDGMRIVFGEKIEVQTAKPRQGQLDKFF